MVMQFDLGAVIIATVTCILTAGISYGIFKEKMKRFEKDLAQHISDDDESHERLVSYQYFEGIVDPIQEAIHEIQRDIKKILGFVSSGGE